MTSRASWKGSLTFSGLSIPVRAFNAVDSAPSVEMHQYHAECKSRISQRKVCPLHGELKSHDIVSGHELVDGEVVLINADCANDLKVIDNKSLEISCFTSVDSVDLTYLSGKHLYVVPDGTTAQRPYAVMQKTLSTNRVVGFGQITLYGRELLAIVEALGRVLRISILEYAEKVRSYEDFESELDDVVIDPIEFDLANRLVGSLSRPALPLEEYRDPQPIRLGGVIERLAKSLRSSDSIAATENPKLTPELNVGMNSQSALEAALLNALREGDAGRSEPVQSSNTAEETPAIVAIAAFPNKRIG